MLYFRRICLLVALVLSFGASDLFAQDGGPPGISVKIVTPADSAWVGLESEGIVVDVHSVKIRSNKFAESKSGQSAVSFIEAFQLQLHEDLDDDGKYDAFSDRTTSSDSDEDGAYTAGDIRPGNPGSGDPGLTGVGRASTFETAVNAQTSYAGSIAKTYDNTDVAKRKEVTWTTDTFIITGKVQDNSGGTHIARYTFKARTGGTVLGDKTGVFVRVYQADATTTDKDITNLEAGGDGKLVKVDNVRPTHNTTDFAQVGVSDNDDGKVDLAELDAGDPIAAEKPNYKIGDSIRLTAEVKTPVDAEAISVGLGMFAVDNAYHESYASHPDSALGGVRIFKIGDDVAGAIDVGGKIILRHTVRVEEDAFKVLGRDGTVMRDNLRFRVGVFLVDRAGNRSTGASMGPYSGAATGVHPAPNVFPPYTVDSKRPDITVMYPVDHPDSNRFTGLVEKAFTNMYRNDNNRRVSLSDELRKHRPLKLKVHEAVLDNMLDIRIVTPKDSLVEATIPYSPPAIGDSLEINTVGKFKTLGNIPAAMASKRKVIPSSLKGGQKVDLIIAAEDMIGNRDSVTVKGVIHDQDPPNPTRLFPSNKALADDKINNETRHPVLRFDEVLDSLSVRFVQNISDGPDTAIQQVGSGDLSKVNQSYTVTVKDSLKEGETYYFQIFARDLSGNVHVSDEDTLTFESGFRNPTADMFVVTTNVDSVLAGKTLTLTIAAVDSMQRRINKDRGAAVTYRSDVRVSAWDGDGLASSVVFSGGGAAKNEDGTYTVKGSGWNAGELTGVKVKSNTVIDNFSILVEEVREVDVDGEPTTVANFNGKKDSLYVDADQMQKFKVTAWEDGEEAKTVSGEFGVNVVPTDKFGNPSIKKVSGNPALDTRITNANKFTNFSVVLSANHPRASVPGAQVMALTGKTFTVIAPDGDGTGLTITARVDNATPGSTQKFMIASGSVTVDYSAVAPTAADSLAAVASVTVMDVPDDQGHHVVVTFPLSTDHAMVDEYRLYREMDVGDGSGPRFIQWGQAIEPSGADSIVTVYRSVPDAMATHWAIEAIGDKPSSPTPSGKLSAAVIASPRTQTAEPVAALDNIAPEAATNVMLEDLTVSWTLSPSEGPTDATYTDPRFEGSQERAIPGVTGYEIMVGLSADALNSVGKVDAGESSFTLSVEAITPLITAGVITQAQLAELLANDLLGVVVRVDALDPNPDNSTPSMIFTVEKVTRKAFMSADGAPVFIVNLEGDMTVGFDDFMTFAAAFNTREGDDAWNVQADLNDDGEVNFADFILFVGSYGKTAQGPSTKPVILPPGVNENAEFSLRLGSERVVVGQNVFVDVSLANVQALMGYGFVLNYDADKFEFVEAAPATEDLLQTTGGETPLFSVLPGDAGQVSIANAVVNASEIAGGGDIVRLTFRVLQEFEENARFEIAEGLVFDPQQLSNPAVVAGVLDVQTTPTEFALLQNFPNPFNPETTIGYELAESADVTLQIYNVVGQVVRTLIAAESQSAGRYQMRWNGMDDRGVPVSSGVYFYQISAGEFQTVRKLMLLK